MFAFGFRFVSEDYHKSRESYLSEQNDRIHKRWVGCVERLGSNENAVYRKQMQSCSERKAADRASCASGNGPFTLYPDECAENIYNLCMKGFEYAEPRCRAISDEHNEILVDAYSTFPLRPILYFAANHYSQRFWIEVALLLFGPITFWLAPKLARWLYSP